jgi:hypothetical protein
MEEGLEERMRSERAAGHRRHPLTDEYSRPTCDDTMRRKLVVSLNSLHYPTPPIASVHYVWAYTALILRIAQRVFFIDPSG